jgi:hypothetical protein
MKKVIYIGDVYEITLRETMASIVIVLLMLTLGVFISEKIKSAIDEKNQEYEQAVKIEDDSDLFAYGMKTNVGNAFVAGTLEAVDTVSYPELKGEYSYIYKTKKVYTKHKKTVKDHDSKGNVIGSHTETYYTWDYAGSEVIHCNTIKFCGMEFDYSTIELPASYYKDTIKTSMNVKYEYYVKDTIYYGTIYANLGDNTITHADFTNNADAAKAYDIKCNDNRSMLVVFGIAWIIIIAVTVYGFCYLDNKWLED